LIERILDQHYDGIMEREGLKGNDRQHVHGRSRYDQLCPVSTPFDYKTPTLDAADCLAEPDPAAVHLVQVVNGLFQYLVITRLDLIFVTNQLSCIAHSPAFVHVKAMDHVLRYLAGTTGFALFLDPVSQPSSQDTYDHGFYAFADSSHKIAELRYKGVTGYIIFYQNCPVSARSVVQDQVTFSSSESEYIAYSSACQEVESLRLLLRDMGIVCTAVPIFRVDNQPAIRIAAATTSRSKSRHIDYKVHLCRDFVTRGLIDLKYIATTDQLADFFTKQLGPKLFLKFRDQLLCLIPRLQSALLNSLD
jgi:hypothetical protein